MKKVMVYFIFKHHHANFQVCLSEMDAANIMKLFRQNRSGQVGGHLPDEDMHWSVALEDVASVYTKGLERLQWEMQQAQKEQQKGKPSIPPTAWGFGSGHN